MERLKQQVYDMAMRCYNEALFAGTSGNLSLYDRANGRMAITPSSVDYTELKPADIVLMRLDGTHVLGHYPPSSEWRLHAALYTARSDVNAVVHTHSPYATAFAVVHQPLPLILNEMIGYIGGAVPLAAYATPGTEAVGTQTVAALGKSGACLMANHGAVAVGKDLAQAYTRAVYVEDSAKVAHLAATLGTPVTLTDAQQQELRDVLAGNTPK